jgi:8-oxo-dGTP pyrophosphatase MutT (NUDIX family)
MHVCVHGVRDGALPPIAGQPCLAFAAASARGPSGGGSVSPPTGCNATHRATPWPLQVVGCIVEHAGKLLLCRRSVERPGSRHTPCALTHPCCAQCRVWEANKPLPHPLFRKPRVPRVSVEPTTRAIEPCRGKWTVPAGFLEVGESTMAGAARETMEEAGAAVRGAAACAAGLDGRRLTEGCQAALDAAGGVSSAETLHACTPSVKLWRLAFHQILHATRRSPKPCCTLLAPTPETPGRNPGALHAPGHPHHRAVLPALPRAPGAAF